MKKKAILLAVLVISIPLNAFAQEKKSQKEKRDRNIYVELLGASNLVGISYDARIKKTSNWGYRLGISYFRSIGSSFYDSSNSCGVLFPLEVNYLMGKKKSKLELGVGANLGSYSEKRTFMVYNEAQNTLEDRSISQSTFGYYFFSNIGYRYQSTKGFLFRVGISPSFSFKGKHALEKKPFILPYIGFGYSF